MNKELSRSIALYNIKASQTGGRSYSVVDRTPRTVPATAEKARVVQGGAGARAGQGFSIQRSAS